MIEKIGHREIFGKTVWPSASQTLTGGIDFQALLREKMDESKPLEMITLQYLRSALDLALSEERPAEDIPFFPQPMLFPRNSPPPPETEIQFPQMELPLDFEASNFLHKEQDFESIVREAGGKYGVDPSLIRAVMNVESGGNPMAVSRAGAKGLMQLMPGTAAELGVANPFDPAENIMGGTRYLRQLLDRYRGDTKLALAAYNWGMGNLEKRPEAMPKETKSFISRVENQYRYYAKA